AKRVARAFRSLRPRSRALDAALASARSPCGRSPEANARGPENVQRHDGGGALGAGRHGVLGASPSEPFRQALFAAGTVRGLETAASRSVVDRFSQRPAPAPG